MATGKGPYYGAVWGGARAKVRYAGAARPDVGRGVIEFRLSKNQCAAASSNITEAVTHFHDYFWSLAAGFCPHVRAPRRFGALEWPCRLQVAGGERLEVKRLWKLTPQVT